MSFIVKDHRKKTAKRQDPGLLCPEAAARLLNVFVYELKDWLTGTTGPRFIRISARTVHYRRSDLEAWLKRRERGHAV